MKKLLCRLLGHRMDIVGATGVYRWCSRCSKKELTAFGINSTLRGFMADLGTHTTSPPKPYFWLGAEAEGL